jgi:GNAT superfamily N-acetyltransferase
MDMGFSIRMAEAADRDEVISLCCDSLLAEDTADVDGLRRLLWEAPDGGDGLRLVAHVGSRLVGACFGTLTIGSDQVVSGSVALIAVQSDNRRAGIGSALLAELEAQLRTAGATEVCTGGGQPQYWWPGIDVRYQAALEFFGSRGYVKPEEIVNMTVSLSGPVVTGPRPGGVEIRRLTAAEAPDFQRWMHMTWGAEWAREVQLTLARDPISCHVARENGDYIGFAGYDTNRLGWFGPMGTSVAARGRGVGATLLRCCLGDYLDRGEVECQVAWVGPQDFYRMAVGAQFGRTFVRMRRAIASALPSTALSW